MSLLVNFGLLLKMTTTFYMVSLNNYSVNGKLIYGFKVMNKNITRLLAISLIALVTACGSNPSNSSSSTASNSSKTSNTSSISASSSSSKSSSSAPDTKPVTLSTTDGLSIEFINKGAAINKISYGSKQIAKDGFIAGRCANRIANGRFTLNGQTYNVTKNDGQNSLHGGGSSWQGPFGTANWTKEEQTTSSVTYSLESADNDNGYPGKMNISVKYTLSQSGELLIEYNATTTKDTLCNPTNHLFIDINGSRSYNNVKLWIDADNYTPLNSNKIPTGQIATVAGTQYDYRTEKAFDSSKNYDDNYVLNATEYAKVATLSGSQYKVDVFTNRPGLQLYKDGSGNICLETQMFPDAINQSAFEDPILRAGETFYSKTAYCFSKLS